MEQMAKRSLGQTFLKNFQQQTQPQVQSNIIPQPLSTKTGINSQKKTALQQGMLQALAQPQMGAMQNGNR